MCTNSRSGINPPRIDPRLFAPLRKRIAEKALKSAPGLVPMAILDITNPSGDRRYSCPCDLAVTLFRLYRLLFARSFAIDLFDDFNSCIFHCLVTESQAATA